MVQALICIVGADVVMRTQKRKLDRDRGSMPFGLVIAAIGFAPFAIYGAFGSFGDALSLLASLAFAVPTGGNIDGIFDRQFFPGWYWHWRGAGFAWLSHRL